MKQMAMRRRAAKLPSKSMDSPGASAEGPRHAQLSALSSALSGGAVQRRPAAGDAPPGQETPNRTGLPNELKAGIEAISGLSMDDVQVHRNSPKPAQLQAHAYAQGAHIHLAPGQERHLPHEAWHVVQQKQGRVRATMQMQGMPVNTDHGLELEADRAGDLAARFGRQDHARPIQPVATHAMLKSVQPIQPMLRIAGAVADAIPPDHHPEHAEIINGWIAQGDHQFADWQAAIAMADAVGWLAGHGWQVAPQDILNPALTEQNCHGLTFHQPWMDFDTIHDFLNEWQQAGQPRVMLCLQGSAVAHSATWNAGHWEQTLPGGPEFRTDRQAIAAHYTCFDLGDAAQLAAIRQRDVQYRQGYEQARLALIARCNAALDLPNASEDLRAYADQWRAWAQEEALDANPQNSNLIQSYDEQLGEMGG